jgi:ABC-type lipoprotein release transport system permease subunit
MQEATVADLDDEVAGSILVSTHRKAHELRLSIEFRRADWITPYQVAVLLSATVASLVPARRAARADSSEVIRAA